MIYEMKPLDNFFFRSPVPFEAGGETTTLNSIFPPLPSSYAGAFKTLLLQEKCSKHSFKIGLNGVTMDGKFMFPLPADLYITEQDETQIWHVKAKSLKANMMSNYPLDDRMCRQQDMAVKEKEQILPYIQDAEMGSYLRADMQNLTCMDLSHKLHMEEKIGIEIDRKSKVSKDQRMYTTLSVRPDDRIRLAVDVQGELKGEQGIIRLGGEGRLAEFRKMDCRTDVGEALGHSCYFKIYFATPAIFRNGWLPGWIDQEKHTGYFSYRNKTVKLKLISACVGRAIPCGGFGFAAENKEQEKKWRPTEMRYAVPAGSVYYFKILKGTFEDAVKLFHKKCISEYREGLGFDYQVFNRSRYCDRGFGYSLVGSLSKEQEDYLNVQ